MQKKIYKNMIFIGTFSIILISILFILVFVNLYNIKFKRDIKSKTYMLESVLDENENDMEIINKLIIDIRLTLIDKDGNVIFDNLLPPENMDNHISREEVAEALDNGYGESKRFSASSGKTTYYNSVVLDDGNILRISETTGNIYKLILEKTPTFILGYIVIILLCHILSKKLTYNIVSPLLEYEYGKKTDYEELSPFINIIEKQRNELESHIEQIKNRGETINTILENMNEGLILIDKNKNINYANKSILNLYKRSENIIGNNIVELIREQEVLEKIKELEEDKTLDFIIEKGESYFNIILNRVQNDKIIILFLDVTDKIESENIRKEFSANVSHELKTPLTTIMGYSEMINSGIAEPKDIALFSEKIKKEAKRMLNLIEDIILLSQLEEDKNLVDFEYFNMEDLIKEAMEALRYKAGDIKLTVEGSCCFKGNRSLIYDMVYNLIDNGIKYNKPEGQVKISLKEDLYTLTIIVEDTGIGISNKDLSRIFERFYRTDKSRSKKTGGTGLGLSIVKHIALYHQGDIKVESKETEGTKVSVTLKKTL